MDEPAGVRSFRGDIRPPGLIKAICLQSDSVSVWAFMTLRVLSDLDIAPRYLEEAALTCHMILSGEIDLSQLALKLETATFLRFITASPTSHDFHRFSGITDMRIPRPTSMGSAEGGITELTFRCKAQPRELPLYLFESLDKGVTYARSR